MLPSAFRLHHLCTRPGLSVLCVNSVWIGTCIFITRSFRLFTLFNRWDGVNVFSCKCRCHYGTHKSTGWRHIGLFTVLSDNQTKEENSFFECKTVKTMLSESFPLQPQNPSPPTLPGLTAPALIPSQQLPRRHSFPFLTLFWVQELCSAQFIQRAFWVFFSLFDLAALTTRHTVSTFNLPVCSLI